MTTFTIISATETDVVALGQSREEVRAALGTHRTLRRTPESEEADHFVDSGAIATYSPKGELVLVEMHDPALVMLDGVQLMGQTVDDITRALAERGIDVVHDEVGATVPSMAVGLYAPGGKVEGVGLGSD